MELGQLKLKEFYFESNPLLPHIPVPAEQEAEVLPLRVSHPYTVTILYMYITEELRIL